jgi:E3 ubiquitin-protein ligase synoviolin
MRFAVYSFLSTALTLAVVSYAYITREQFYPAVIFLVTSKFSIMILGNMALVLTLLLGRIVKFFFLGSLVQQEVELLYENSRFAVTETCLALTIFREELNVQMAGLFTALLFAKIFHWLCQSRVEWLEQQEQVPRLTYARMFALMATLMIADVGFVAVASFVTIQKGPSVLLLFGFEFLVLGVTCATIFLRFILHLIDQRSEGNWENKSIYLMTVELCSEVLRLSVYLVFFMIIFTYYGLPLHIVRDLWVSLRKLQSRLQAYFRYRRIMRNINERFADPTEQEVTDCGGVCIVCREDMANSRNKKLPCGSLCIVIVQSACQFSTELIGSFLLSVGHIFHLYCLRKWLQEQQVG